MPKITERQIVRSGLLITYDDGKKSLLSNDQIATCKALDVNIGVGTDVKTTPSVSPVDNQPSDTWVKLTI